MRIHVTSWLWPNLLAVLVISTVSSDDCNTSDLKTKCLNGGTCVDGMPGRYSCICVPGITGDRCENQIDECASNPCKNKATCISDLNRYRCFCLPGWTGTNCDLDINECDSNPCQNQGKCYNGRNFYNCTCWDGFTGVNCEININDCDPNPCQNGATCTDLVDRFSCTCKTGFIGSRCERKLGECTDIEGFPNGHVTIHREKFAMYRCNAGYKMSGIRFRRCKNGQWEGKAPVCIAFARSCEEPDDILHGGYNGGSLTVGSKVKYFCGEKYVLRGNAEATCRPNLKWYPRKTPYCIRKKKCQDPGTPKDGSRDGSLFLEGSQVRFSCKEGYELVGSSMLSCARVCRSCTFVSWKGTRPKCEKIDPLRALQKVAQTLRKNFIDKLGWLTSDGLARSGLSSGAEGLDLVFVFDSSASVGKENFKKGINFTKTIIDEFGISASPTGTRVAVVTFSSQAQVVFNLKSKEITTKEKANAVLDGLDYIAGGTATSLALNKTIEEVVPQARNNSKKALFLITDGQSNDGGDPRAEARILRHFLDFEIYAIGVTNMVDEDELQGIASDPFRTHVFLLKDFADLAKLKEIITANETDYSECGIAGDTQLTEGADGKKIQNAGGREAKRGAWPWQVAVYVDGNFRCAGALIREDWVLTVAHCFFFHGNVSAANVLVRLGDHDRFKDEGSEQNVGAKKLVLHPQANQNRIGDDLALIKLRSGVKLSPFVRPVCLPEPNDLFYVRPGKSCVIAGWGSTQMASRVNLAGPPHPVLQQIQMKFVSNQRCQVNATKATDITDKVICAGDSEGERNACKGDNGSPLVIRRSDDSWVMIGVSSWGEGCATRGKYGVYTRVRSYTRWINRKINKFKKNAPK